MVNTGKPILKKVLYLSAESSPYIKVGGLGDVSGSLPPILMKLYADLFDIRLVLPYHAGLQLKTAKLVKVSEFPVSFPNCEETAIIWQDQAAPFPVYLLESPTISATPPYTDDAWVDLKKYCLFSQMVHLFTNAIHWTPDLYHANDWHTALAVYQTGTRAFKKQRITPYKTILSIHNLPYMGHANRKVLKQFGFTPSTNKSLPAWARDLPLPMGISRADQVLTVSNGYAQEIMTPHFGCGLDDYLKNNSAKVAGILNGIDQSEWDPKTDPLIQQHFSQETLSDRLKNKQYLFDQYFPSSSLDVPLLIWVGRLQHQKGADILLESLKNIIQQDCRCIILGTGDPALEYDVSQFSAQYPQKIVAIPEFSNALSHQLYAGGDMIIMPSRYEPCGLSQMFAMRYGCLAIATATGGLKDTISDHVITESANGFLFQDATATACSNAIQTAIKICQTQPQFWQTMQINAMKKNFSWNRSAEQYKNVYLKLLESPS